MSRSTETNTIEAWEQVVRVMGEWGRDNERRMRETMKAMAQTYSRMLCAIEPALKRFGRCCRLWIRQAREATECWSPEVPSGVVSLEVIGMVADIWPDALIDGRESNAEDHDD